jgi:peptidoglycan hydrolase-like protein with peptidoglycan-binding domain
MNPFILLPLVMRLVALLPQLVKFSQDPLVLEVIKLVQQFAGQLFPNLGQNATIEGTIDHVKWIQTQMNDRGFGDLKIDGVYGPRTQAAVKRFQASVPGLDVDGWFGKKSAEALRSLQHG